MRITIVMSETGAAPNPITFDTKPYKNSQLVIGVDSFGSQVTKLKDCVGVELDITTVKAG